MSVFKMRTRNVFVLLFHRQKNVFCRLFFDYRCKDSKNSVKYKKVQKFKKCKVQEVKVGGENLCSLFRSSTSQTLLKEGFKSPLGDLGVKHNLASKKNEEQGTNSSLLVVFPLT